MLTGGLRAANTGLVCGDAGVTERYANQTKDTERSEIAKEAKKQKQKQQPRNRQKKREALTDEKNDSRRRRSCPTESRHGGSLAVAAAPRFLYLSSIFCLRSDPVSHGLTWPLSLLSTRPTPPIGEHLRLACSARVQSLGAFQKI